MGSRHAGGRKAQTRVVAGHLNSSGMKGAGAAAAARVAMQLGAEAAGPAAVAEAALVLGVAGLAAGATGAAPASVSSGSGQRDAAGPREAAEATAAVPQRVGTGPQTDAPGCCAWIGPGSNGCGAVPANPAGLPL